MTTKGAGDDSWAAACRKNRGREPWISISATTEVLETKKSFLARPKSPRQNKYETRQRVVWGAYHWKGLVRELSPDVEAVTRSKPNDPKEIVSETLVEALNIATSTNLSMRSTEALQTLLQHCDELNERELIGLCKVVSDQSMLGKSNVDGKRQKLVNVVTPKVRLSDDSALATNQRSRRQTLDLPHHAQE